MADQDLNLNLGTAGAVSFGISAAHVPQEAAHSTVVRLQLIDESFVDVPRDLYECLLFESEDRGISLAAAYQEEIDARRYLESNSLSNEELDRIAPRKSRH